MKIFRDLVVICLITVLLCELVVRLFGYSAYKIQPFSIQSEPALSIIPDFELGFGLNPGRYTVTVNDQLIYTTTHDDDSSRITHHGLQADTLPRRVIDIHGCSFTYGWGVDDSLSYPFLLQNDLPGWRVRNLAVPGYGTLQSLMTLEKQIADGLSPEVLVLNYAGFHDERNALTPVYRQSLKNGFELSNEEVRQLFRDQRFPYSKVDQNGNLEIKYERWQDIHRDWPLRKRSALVNFLQFLTEENAKQKIDKRLVTRLIIDRIQANCNKSGIRFILAGMTQDPETSEMLGYAKGKGIEILPMGIDLNDTAYNNLPADSHPNARAHAAFAERVLGAFDTQGPLQETPPGK